MKGAEKVAQFSTNEAKATKTTTMAELMFGLGQTKKKKEVASKVKQEKDDRWKYQGNANEDAEAVSRKEHFDRDQGYKATQKDTKTNLKDVTVTETVESEVRKEQHGREKDWKDKGRQQKQENTSFDMAKALFN